MSFVARTFEEILADMIAYVQGNTPVEDFSVGSVVRTILEAAATEDDEQYFQMTQLLDAFSIINAFGEDLDGRVADYDIFRRSEKFSVGYVKFADGNLVTDQSSQDYPVGSTSLQLFSTSSFPVSYPYTIRCAEGTSRVQDLTVTGNNTTSATLTLSTPTVDDIEIGDRVSFVDPTGSAKNISIGTVVQVPANVGNPARLFSTEENASILPGNYYSNEVLVKAQASGKSSNVSSGKISQFLGSRPFTGALVTNTLPTGGGLAKESDKELKIRALKQIQSISRGTPLSLKTFSVGVVDTATSKTVVSANIIEDFANDEVNIYIDDGTGFIPTSQTMAQDSLSEAATIGTFSLKLTDASNFPSVGYVFISVDASNHDAELVEYSNIESNTISLVSGTTIAHDVGAIVYLVEPITLSAESSEKRFRLSNFPVVRFSDRIYIDQGSGWVSATPDSTYKLNRGTGEFQILDSSGVLSGSKIIANYNYYTNLIAKVQKVLEGDENDPINFPGVKASGIFLNVEPPVLRRITVRAEITADLGYNEVDLASSVVENIENYIRNLGIGEDVIRSEMIYEAQKVTGVKDINITTPSSNVIILENELPIPFDSTGASLVQVF